MLNLNASVCYPLAQVPMLSPATYTLNKADHTLYLNLTGGYNGSYVDGIPL